MAWVFHCAQAAVKLIPSVPGRHLRSDDPARQWGQDALKWALRGEVFPAAFRFAPLVAQFSSVGR